MLIDSHSHLNFKAYDADRDEVIKRTQEQGVVCINIGTKYETSKAAIELAEKHDGLFAAVGMHPFHIRTDVFKIKTDKEEGDFAPLGEDFDYEKYKELAKSSKVVAIGEIGLDYYYKPKGTAKKEKFKQQQKEVFVKQLDLAEELGLPVILHSRMAYAGFYEILSARAGRIKGVVHSFVGTAEEMKSYIDLGLYIGFNGIIFSALGRPASGGKLPLDEAIKACPLDKMLIETDCPYLTPPKAGPKDMRNEPIHVKYIAERIAEIKNIPFEQVAAQTTQNAKNLFKI